MKHQSNTQNQSLNRKAQRGQSLVEVALFFPIFIILLAGLVEVSQLLITQNRVSSAARAATRFASNGGQDEGIPTTVLNTVTQTLEIDESVWDVWSIRGTINDNGTGINDDDWQFTHVYGISNTVRAPSVNEDNIRTRVLEELQRDELGNPSTEIAEGLQFVGTYAIHDVDSILGLDAMSQLAGFSSIDALTVMRITADGQNVTDGCAAFPIAVREGERSVTAPNTGSNPYPNASQFDYPNNPPVYESFTSHTADVPLLSATEGDVFRIQNGFGQGNFGWLAWNSGLGGEGTLGGSLSWPGDSTNYNLCTGANGCAPGTGVPGSGFNRNVRGYINPIDPRDHAMHIGDWVWGGPGTVNSNEIRTTLQSHMSLDRHLRVVVWNESAAGGNNGRYRISGFAIFRLIGYNLNQSQGSSWILAEFIRWDNSCGQVN